MICWHSTRCCHGSRRNCALWILISIRCNRDLRVIKNIRKEEKITMIERSAVKILVLDDESFMLKLLSRILSNLGFTSVTLCDSGRAALEQLAEADANTGPNLILLDLNMPEMDGIEFVRHLVERHYSGSLILVSGEDERILQTTEKLVQAHKIQILGHLHKPVKPEALSALLEKWTAPSMDSSGAAKKAYGADELRAALDNGE